MNTPAHPHQSGIGARSDCRAILQWIPVAGLLWSFVPALHAEVVYHMVNYPQGVVAGWPNIDFDGDGTAEVSFEHYALGHEWGGVMFLNVHGSETCEVLLDGGGVLPLYAGNAISLTPALGHWQPPGYQSSVWTWSFSFPPPESTNIVIVRGDPPPEPPPGRGLGMAGFGDFMGVRFRAGGDWHYAWVRFGMLDDTSLPLPNPGWPSVLEYAYERRPGVPILTGAKPVPIPLASPEVARPGYLRLKWVAQIGRTYQVQAKERLDAFAWTNLSFALPAAATNMMVDLPMECAAQFFRIVEAD
jgi:hypothetical protein